jgi:hypothetical protein
MEGGGIRVLLLVGKGMGWLLGVVGMVSLLLEMVVG